MGAYHWRYYYESRKPFYVATIEAIRDLVPEGSVVLDLGCGDGLLANVLSEERNCRVTGVDLHPTAVSLARQRNMNKNTFCVKSAYKLRFESKFDVVLAVEIFEHIRKPRLMLANARKALRDGGWFIVTTPLLNPAKPPSKYHVREYTKEEFHGMVEEYFCPEKARFIERPDGKSNCYVLKCRKRD
jgi:2-polyprenyl-3-methyl-5-hydroxy-6-metoxy-1,4-benzoquinol methylase